MPSRGANASRLCGCGQYGCKGYYPSTAPWSDSWKRADSPLPTIVGRRFMWMGAFTRDSVTRTCWADLERMLVATDSLSAKILTLQGDGDYAGLQAFMQKCGSIGPELQSDLDRLAAGIPVDVTFRRGIDALQ